MFHPNATYFNTSPAERAKLIFPEGLVLREAKGRGESHRGRVEYEKDDVDRQYGATWFLDKVAEETGVKDDLLKVFGNNMEKANEILTMAYFPFIDNLSYSQMARWQKEVKAPTEISITPKAVTLLTQSITEQNRMDMFRCRALRLGKDELCAVDSTSMSTYGVNLVDIRWGRNKKYGLVWEEKPEDIEDRLRDELPVLIESNDDKVHSIISDNPEAPNHLIIEGDNLAALTELSYTHAGKIDVIYIDPPYNTGKKDFVYNDTFIDREDSFRHSKWISFMAKRLSIAHGLLSPKGVIFLSIDDNEQADLKLLCDEIFGESNFLGQLILKTALYHVC